MAVVAGDVVNGMTSRDLIAMTIIIAAALAIGFGFALWLRRGNKTGD